MTGFSLGTQYTFSIVSDGEVTAESVAQNPGLMDTELCSNSGCSTAEPG